MTLISDTIAQVNGSFLLELRELNDGSQAFTATLDGVPFSCDSVKTCRLILWALFGLAPAVMWI